MWTEVAVARVSVLAEQADTTETSRKRDWLSPQWLIPLGFLLLAVAMTWHLWADPAGRAPTTDYGISKDVYLSTWSLRYVATALSHGHLPALVTTALNAPRGVYLMWNTSILLPGIVLTPITLLAGPTASLAVMLTLGFAGSATAMYFVLRRWDASHRAAALAGLIYGFGPAMSVAAEAHYHLQFAVLPPIIIHLALRLLTGRGHPVRTGVWLGLLISAQVFISEETLVDTAVAGAVLLAVLFIFRPRSLQLEWAKATAVGFGIAVVIAVLLCGHALLVQFHGPMTETGSPWKVSLYGNQPADFVVAPDAMMLHGSNYLGFLRQTNQRLVEYFAYLGWPMLVVLAAVTIAFWRDLRVRVVAVTFALLEIFSIGGASVRLGPWHIPTYLLPWSYVQHASIIGQILPNRFSLMADGFAAIVLAFAADRAWAAAKELKDWRKPTLAGVAAAALAAALVPALPKTMWIDSVPPPPAGWNAVIAGLHLKPGDPLLVVPLRGAETMELQAVTNGPYSLAGGYCITRAWRGSAVACESKHALTDHQQTTLLRLNWLAAGKPALHNQPSHVTMEIAVRDWHAEAIVTTAGGNSVIGRYLLHLFGAPTAHDHSVLGWRLGPGWEQRLPSSTPAG